MYNSLVGNKTNRIRGGSTGFLSLRPDYDGQVYHLSFESQRAESFTPNGVGHSKLSHSAATVPGCHLPLALVLLLLARADATAFHKKNKKNIVLVVVLDKVLFNSMSKTSFRKEVFDPPLFNDQQSRWQKSL